jgi:hypothetical protein
MRLGLRAQRMAAYREIRKSEPGHRVRKHKAQVLQSSILDGEMVCDRKAFEIGIFDPCKHILSVALTERGVH